MTARSRIPRLPELFLGLLALAVAAVVVAYTATDAIRDSRHTRDTVTVTGSATMPIEADLAQWTLVVSDTAKTPALAAQLLRGHLTAVRAFLRAAGVAGDEVGLSVLTTETLVERLPKRRVLRTYRVAQSIEVQTRKLDIVEKVATEIGDLVERGITVEPQAPAYVSTELGEAKLNALEAATKDARRRAEILVEGFGGKLGRLRSSSLGVYQVTPRFSTEVTDYGVNDTSTRDKDVRAVLTVTFDVKT